MCELAVKYPCRNVIVAYVLDVIQHTKYERIGLASPENNQGYTRAQVPKKCKSS